MFKKNKIDYSILGFVFIFFLISVVTINSALTYLPSDVGNLALKQVIWYGVGLLLVFIIFKVKNEYLYRNGQICVIYITRLFVHYRCHYLVVAMHDF